MALSQIAVMYNESMSEPTTEQVVTPRRRFLITGSCVVLVVALATIGVIYFHARVTSAGLPPATYNRLSFPIYFPKHLPPDFALDKRSISSTPSVLTYKYDYKGSRPVFVSIQPLDPQLDTSSFRPTREIDTSIGHGYLVEYEERTTIAILTSKTLVLINAPQKIPGAAIEQFADDLQTVK